MSHLSMLRGGQELNPERRGLSLLLACTPGSLASRVGSNPGSIASLCLHADKCPSTTLHSKKSKLSPPGRHDGKTTETFSFQLLFTWS